MLSPVPEMSLYIDSAYTEWVKDSSTFDSQSFELNPEVSIRSLCHIFHPTPQTFENAALFPRLGLPSTSIRHENGVLRKHSSIRRDLKKPALIFNVDEKNFQNGALIM